MRHSYKRIFPTFIVMMALLTTFAYIIDYTHSRTVDQILGLAFFGAILTTAIVWVLFETDRPSLKTDAYETLQEKQKRQRLDVLLRDFSAEEMRLLQARLEDIETDGDSNHLSEQVLTRKHKK